MIIVNLSDPGIIPKIVFYIITPINKTHIYIYNQNKNCKIEIDKDLL